MCRTGRAAVGNQQRVCHSAAIAARCGVKELLIVGPNRFAFRFGQGLRTASLGRRKTSIRAICCSRSDEELSPADAVPVLHPPTPKAPVRPSESRPPHAARGPGRRAREASTMAVTRLSSPEGRAMAMAVTCGALPERCGDLHQVSRVIRRLAAAVEHQVVAGPLPLDAHSPRRQP